MLKAIESTNLPVVHQAKKEPCYKHVLLFKLLGHQGHRLVLKMVVIAQSIGQKLMRNNH